MKFFKWFLIFVFALGFLAEESEAAKRRRRRGRRGKLYSPPTKFQLQNRKAYFEIKKDKMILTHEKGRTEQPVPFQTKSDKVAGMVYIPLGGRDFVQMVVWVVDVKGNVSPGATVEMNGQDIGQLLYWNLYEVVDDRIVWRQHQLLDQFLGKMDHELPAHLENAIQLAVDESSGKISFRRGAIEEIIAVD